MVTVSDVLATKSGRVFSVDASATVLDAALLMNQHHIGALVVTAGEDVIGIFTERDVLIRVVATQQSPAETIVRDVMTTPVACCQRTTTLDECRAVMTQKRIRHLPVVEENHLLGMISIGDILAKRNADQQETIRYLHDYLYGNTR